MQNESIKDNLLEDNMWSLEYRALVMICLKALLNGSFRITNGSFDKVQIEQGARLERSRVKEKLKSATFHFKDYEFDQETEDYVKACLRKSSYRRGPQELPDEVQIGFLWAASHFQKRDLLWREAIRNLFKHDGKLHELYRLYSSGPEASDQYLANYCFPGLQDSSNSYWWNNVQKQYRRNLKNDDLRNGKRKMPSEKDLQAIQESNQLDFEWLINVHFSKKIQNTIKLIQSEKL